MYPYVPVCSVCNSYVPRNTRVVRGGFNFDYISPNATTKHFQHAMNLLNLLIGFSDHSAIFGIRKLHRVPLPPLRMIKIRNYKHYIWPGSVLWWFKKYPLGYFGTWTYSQWGVAFFQRSIPDSTGQTFTNCNTACSRKIRALVNEWNLGSHAQLGVIMNIRKQYQQIVGYTGVFTKDYIMLST